MTKNLEAMQQIEEFTNGLTLEVFIDVMTTANVVNSSYKKLFPNTTDKETYGQMWENIKSITSSH